MNTLIVGDIHAKPEIIHKVERCLRKGFDVVLVGDYVDDWSATPMKNKFTTKKLIELKEEFGKRLTLLIGNHDLSEAFGLEHYQLRCAGFDPEVADQVSSDIKWLIKKGWLEVWTRVGDYMVSHAGFTDKWFVNMTDGDVNNLLKDAALHRLQKLNMCGPARGGNDYFSGPLWADKTELVSQWSPREPKQIVGHTPVETCVRHKTDEVDLWFIDTFSTRSDGSNIGDQTILLISEGEPVVTTFMEVLNESDS